MAGLGQVGDQTGRCGSSFLGWQPPCVSFERGTGWHVFNRPRLPLPIALFDWWDAAVIFFCACP